MLDRLVPGSLSLIDCVTDMSVWGEPSDEDEAVVSPNFHVVSVARNDGEEDLRLKARLIMEGPQGRETEIATETLTMQSLSVHRWIVGVRTFNLDGEGVYAFRVEHEDDGQWETFSTVELFVNYAVGEDAPEVAAERESPPLES